LKLGEFLLFAQKFLARADPLVLRYGLIIHRFSPLLEFNLDFLL
jgi:hypothetical protein